MVPAFKTRFSWWSSYSFSLCPVIAPHFPGEEKDNEIRLVNDGLVAWVPGQYELVNVDNRYGAAERYPVAGIVNVGDSAE